MIRRDHLLEEELLHYLERGLDDTVIDFHLLECGLCRSRAVDTLVVVRGLPFAKAVYETMGKQVRRAPSRGGKEIRFLEMDSIRDRFLLDPKSALLPTDDTVSHHPENRELTLFYESAHEWAEANRDFLCIARHLMRCDRCFSAYVGLSFRLDPNPETMKKVLNSLPAPPGPPVRALDAIAAYLRSRLGDLGQRISEYQTRSSEFLFSQQANADYGSQQSASFRRARGPVPPPRPSVVVRAIREGGDWQFRLRFTAGKTTTPVTFEIQDDVGAVLASGNADDDGHLAVIPSDSPARSVVITEGGERTRFALMLPDERQLSAIDRLESLMKQLERVIDQERELGERFDRATREREALQGRIQELLDDLES